MDCMIVLGGAMIVGLTAVNCCVLKVAAWSGLFESVTGCGVAVIGAAIGTDMVGGAMAERGEAGTKFRGGRIV